MSDTDRLAALLHAHWLESPEKVHRPDGGIEVYAPCSCGEWVPMPLDVDEGDPVFAFSEHIAARLVAAGVRVGIDATCRDEGCQLQAQTLAYLAGSPRIDPDRLARALARRTDRTDAWVLLPKEMQDLWRKDAAAIVKAYEEEGGKIAAQDDGGWSESFTAKLGLDEVGEE